MLGESAIMNNHEVGFARPNHMTPVPSPYSVCMCSRLGSCKIRPATSSRVLKGQHVVATTDGGGRRAFVLVCGQAGLVFPVTACSSPLQDGHTRALLKRVATTGTDAVDGSRHQCHTRTVFTPRGPCPRTPVRPSLPDTLACGCTTWRYS